MPSASERIFVAIAVSRPGGGLDPLPGAITAAERMAAWARGQGYITVLLHDGNLPEITVELLREAISQAINQVTDHALLKRLVIFFAGHGAALAVGDQYWILTHWKKDSSQAIKVSALQRMLEYYGPRQVSVIGDACQEFSAQFINLVGSAVLFQPDEEQRPYELDQFFAVDVGKQAFMIKAQGEQKDFCLFTEVLLDALEGDAQGDFFDAEGADRLVTSQSLARYLDSTLAQQAGKYGVRMVARPRPGFYTDRTYLKIPGPPVLPEPPSIHFNAEINLPTAGAAPWIELEPPMLQARVRAVDKARLKAPRSAKAALASQTRALQAGREARRKAFVSEVGSAPVRDHFETGCGLCVSGAEVISVQASSAEVSAIDGQPSWWRIELPSGSGDSLGWSDVLVTLADGRIVPVCVLNGFVAALHIIDADSLSLFHRPLGASEYEGREAIELLAQAQAGLLSRQAIIDSAALLRDGKHRIITLGCIAAQFYDGLRDVDSLRSMAAFYGLHQQPVPLDIILYGGGTLSAVEGWLYADIPAVAAREPRTAQEREQRFTYESTPGFAHHPVAGRIPWMRQAWSALATARCDVSAATWRQQALEVVEHLGPGLFSVIQPSGQAALAQLADIQVTQEPLEPVPLS